MKRNMKEEKKIKKGDIPYPPKTAEDAKKALEYLRQELNVLTASDEGINFFRACSMNGQEIRHSSFLAWLLSPKEKHDFGNRMLRMLFEAVWRAPQKEEYYDGIRIKSNQEILMAADSEGKTVDEASFMDILQGEIEIKTEQVIVHKESRIDLLVVIPKTQTVIVIENKIHSDTHDNQLERYRKEIDHPKSEYRNYQRKFFIFLAPRKEKPINRGGDMKYNSHYCILGYEDIIEMIEGLEADLNAGNTSLKSAERSKLKILLEDYIKMVKSEVLGKSPDVRAKCKDLKKDQTFQWALSVYKQYEESGDNIEEVLKFSMDWLMENGPQETDENGNKVPGIKVFQTRKRSDYTGSINFTTPAMRKFYEGYGEEITAQKTYKIGTENGNVLQFFIMMDRYKNKDWTPAQKLLVPAEKLQKYYCTTPKPFLTWEQRQLECNDEFKNDVLIPKLEYFLQLIHDNDTKLASLTKQP